MRLLVAAISAPMSCLHRVRVLACSRARVLACVCTVYEHTVGGKRIGEAALCRAYAMPTVPAVSEVELASMPTRDSSDAISTPLLTAKSAQTHKEDASQLLSKT